MPARYHSNESNGLHVRKGPWLQYRANICHGGWMEVAKVQRGNCENQPCLLQPGKDGARGNPIPEESWFTIPLPCTKMKESQFLEIIIIYFTSFDEIMRMLNHGSHVLGIRPPLKGSELRLLLHTSAALRPPLFSLSVFVTMEALVCVSGGRDLCLNLMLILLKYAIWQLSNVGEVG